MRRVAFVLILALTGCSSAPRSSSPTATAIPGVTIIKVGQRPCASVPTTDAMWVTNYGDGTISRIDPTTNTVTATDPVGTQPCGIVFLDGHLWVGLVGGQALAEVDPASGKVLATVPTQGQVYDVQTGYGSVWINDNAGGHVLRVDPRTATVTATIAAGTTLYGLAVTPDGVWAADTAGSSITRIDPATDKVVAKIPDPSGTPYTFAATPGALWVSNQPGADAAHRSGAQHDRGHRPVRRVDARSRRSGFVERPGLGTGRRRRRERGDRPGHEHGAQDRSAGCRIRG